MLHKLEHVFGWGGVVGQGQDPVQGPPPWADQTEWQTHATENIITFSQLRLRAVIIIIRNTLNSDNNNKFAFA